MNLSDDGAPNVARPGVAYHPYPILSTGLYSGIYCEHGRVSYVGFGDCHCAPYRGPGEKPFWESRAEPP